MQARGIGRREGIVRGPDEGTNLWWVPLQVVENQAWAPSNPNPSQRYSWVVPPMPWRTPPPSIDPCAILYGNMYIVRYPAPLTEFREEIVFMQGGIRGVWTFMALRWARDKYVYARVGGTQLAYGIRMEGQTWSTMVGAMTAQG